MPRPHFDAVGAVRNRLKFLVGARVVHVDAYRDETCGYFEAWPVLVFELADGTRRRVLLSRDPEGNGPGAIIEEG